MLNDLKYFMKEKPGLLKRALLTNKRIVAWSALPRDTVMTCWRVCSNQPLRLIPLTPLEGGSTQELWNKIWDVSKTIDKNIRQAPLNRSNF